MISFEDFEKNLDPQFKAEPSDVKSEIDRLERENEEHRKSVMVDYFDENNKRQELSIEAADSYNKPREEKVKDEREKKHQKRAMFESMGGKK